MVEYIERDKALNVCEMHYNHCISMQDWRGDTVAWNIGADIKTIPAADVVEVKHGHWYRHDYKTHGDTCYYCSECEKMALTDSGMVWELTPYCPFCGAKMDGDSDV